MQVGVSQNSHLGPSFYFVTEKRVTFQKHPFSVLGVLV